MDHLEACAEGACQSRLTCESILWMYFWTLVNPPRAFFIVIFRDELMATSRRLLPRVSVLVVVPFQAEKEFWDMLFLSGSSLWLAPKPSLSFAGVLRGSALLWQLIFLSFSGWNSSWEWWFLWVTGLQTFLLRGAEIHPRSWEKGWISSTGSIPLLNLCAQVFKYQPWTGCIPRETRETRF